MQHAILTLTSPNPATPQIPMDVIDPINPNLAPNRTVPKVAIEIPVLTLTLTLGLTLALTLIP